MVRAMPVGRQHQRIGASYREAGDIMDQVNQASGIGCRDPRHKMVKSCIDEVHSIYLAALRSWNAY